MIMLEYSLTFLNYYMFFELCYFLIVYEYILCSLHYTVRCAVQCWYLYVLIIYLMLTFWLLCSRHLGFLVYVLY